MAKFWQVNLTFHWHCEAVHEGIPIKSLPQEWLSSCKHVVKARLEGIGWTSTMHYCEEENCMENKSFFHPRISNRAVFLLYSKEQTRRTQILIHPGLTAAGYQWFKEVLLLIWRKGCNDWTKYTYSKQFQSQGNSRMFVCRAFVSHSNLIKD